MSVNDDNSRMSANGDKTKAQASAQLPHNAAKIQAAIDDLKAVQKAHSLRGLSVRQMIEKGRKR